MVWGCVGSFVCFGGVSCCVWACVGFGWLVGLGVKKGGCMGFFLLVFSPLAAPFYPSPARFGLCSDRPSGRRGRSPLGLHLPGRRAAPADVVPRMKNNPKVDPSQPPFAGLQDSALPLTDWKPRAAYSGVPCKITYEPPFLNIRVGFLRLRLRGEFGPAWICFRRALLYLFLSC